MPSGQETASAPPLKAAPVAGLLDFAARVGRHIDASPSPFHAVKHAVRLLTDAGARPAANAGGRRLTRLVVLGRSRDADSMAHLGIP